MPTYQYACTACGHTFDQVQSFYDDALTHCPECDGRLRKVFNAVGVVFKGSGFYRTDSRSGGSSTLPAASSDSSSEGAPASTPAASGSDAARSGATGSGATGSGATGSGATGSSGTSKDG